jgi:hypothetical protein
VIRATARMNSIFVCAWARIDVERWLFLWLICASARMNFTFVCAWAHSGGTVVVFVADERERARII